MVRGARRTSRGLVLAPGEQGVLAGGRSATFSVTEALRETGHLWLMRSLTPFSK